MNEGKIDSFSYVVWVVLTEGNQEVNSSLESYKQIYEMDSRDKNKIIK